MKKEELCELFMISEAELNSIIASDDLKLLKKKYRDAVKVYHPDNGEKADADKFIAIRRIYSVIENSGLRNVIDDVTESIVFDIDEMRKVAITVTDINGNVHDRKKAMASEKTSVRFKLTLNVDDAVYNIECKTEHRIDNKYQLEIRPRVSKQKFFGLGAHSAKLVVNNTREKLSSEISWSSICREFVLRISGDMLIMVVRINLQFYDENAEEA